jgi:hypothetical protein|tara:strand:- start:120 stop:1874 length:1755 start_codon:yes stop_codon:yes gene_type:complete
MSRQDNLGGYSNVSTSGMTAADYADDENFDQGLQQDIAAAAAQAAGINMDSYDFGGFDPGGSDSFGLSNKAAATGILDSYFNDPTKTGRAIRESAPFLSSPRSGLNQFVNLYTSRRGPMSRSDFNSIYDITKDNRYGIETLGYDLAKTLQRYGLGSGQVRTDPNIGRLTGTVFGKKNARGETVLMSDKKSMGIDADKYYSGKSGSDIGRPDLETYQDKYGYADPTERAINRAYDSYINPRNNPDRVGYNRDVPSEYEMQRSAERGQVRPGLRSTAFTDRSGTPTVLGPVVTYDRDFSGADNLAMTFLAPGGAGFLTRMMANPVSGIRDQELPAAALAPTEEMLARGETSGGMSRSLSEAMGQGIGAIGDIGRGIVNTGRDFADLFRTEPEPQVQRQLDDAPLDENMYGRGMFDLAAPLSQTATVPRSSITRNIQEQPVNPATAATIEQLDSLGPYDMNRGFDETGSNIDRMLDDREAQQREGLEEQRRAREAEINAGPYGLTPTEQIILDSSVRSNFPDTIQIADAKTYRSPYQGQSGVFRAGKGKGQTYYGGQKEGSFLDQDYMEQLRQLREKAGNVFNYFTT